MTTDRSIIFYSWQSDLPNATNRGFIERALGNAIRAIHADASIEVEPVIDRDTTGVPGAPDIATTIFDKIARARIFVCDVSIINRGAGTRPTPNPNVLIELGYAMKALGMRQVMLVLNTAFGGPELLPFDLRMRRVIPYAMPAGQEDRATERKKLEAMLEAGVRAILTDQGISSSGVVIQPKTLAEQAQEAIEENRQNQTALVRRYMGSLAEEIKRQAPNFTTGNQSEWEELLLSALAQSLSLVMEFARLSESIASMDAAGAASAVYKGFAGILELYQPPHGFSGPYRSIDFDFAKFIGHELFVSFFSFPIREERWELIADLFEDDLYLEHTARGGPGVVPFDYVSQYIELLDHRNRRLRLNLLSLHANLLNERHTQGDLAKLVPLAQFTEADYFLFLRAQLQQPTAPHGLGWRAWSYLYARRTPRYLVEATRVKVARQLLRPLGVPDLQALRDRFAERAARVEKLFEGGPWENPLWAFDPQSIGSR